MKTITDKLADVLRTVIDTAPGGARANEADNIAAKRDGILALAAYDAQKPAERDGAWWLDLLAKYVDEQKGKATARGDKEAAGVLVNIGAYLILARTDGRGE